MFAKSFYRKPFHYFKNDNLRKLIKKYVNYDRLNGSHLVICATNYSTGDLETFYKSDLIDKFITYETKYHHDSTRLTNFHKIDSLDSLVDALLASAAVPFHLPPVTINESCYVDGGIGNNTPLRQAAHINRFILKENNVNLEPTLCVINDLERFTIDGDEFNDIPGIVSRSLDIYHNQMICDAYFSWEKLIR